MAVVEFARDVLGYTNANSEEFDNITKTKSNTYNGRTNENR